MEAVHKDGAYHCDKCGFMAAKMEELQSHLEVAHRDGNYHCDKCDFSEA